MKEIYRELFSLQDEQYRLFHSSLLPTLPVEKIIGVRMPDLRNLAKKLQGTETEVKFLQELPHQYFDENQVHAILLCMIKDFERCVTLVNKFLPYVNNWATCDCLRPKVFAMYHKELLPYINTWLKDKQVYVLRFGIEMLMQHFLQDDFRESYLTKVSDIRSDDYYVKMMQAWYFAEAMVKQPQAAVAYMETKKLDTWTHNKAIQKACESYRVSDEMKEYLRGLKL